MAESEKIPDDKQRPANRQANGKHKLTGPGPGRKKGVPNKINSEFKAAIMKSFQNRGGVKYLDSLDDALFTSLVRSVIPREIAQDVKLTARLETAISIQPAKPKESDNDSDSG